MKHFKSTLQSPRRTEPLELSTKSRQEQKVSSFIFFFEKFRKIRKIFSTRCEFRKLAQHRSHNITIEGSESAFDTSLVLAVLLVVEKWLQGSEDFATFASETKKHGSDSSSEVPDDVKGCFCRILVIFLFQN